MSETTADFDVDAWREELQAKRAEKDEFFDEHPQSPIPPEERDEFEGLDYFDPAPDYRVTATATAHDDPEVVLLDTTTGREMRYLRTTTLAFDLEREDADLEDGTYELAAYQQERPGSDQEEPLFVPFRDKTTGQQSYEGGRYMELAPERELEDGDELVVDFNLAYTPFCAYSETFDCPLPPEENWLEVAIPAGERFE
ncbi:DUF1684 domain-containing protein [Natronobacterium gregoryi]|uniref:DUF1684 domain-containing protein n=2 Tax=Natronobacterium gregoryi TaxID=44930 RepID=L0AHD3_NATGS|nr:DUF1684 domain-containing protein [Natronobacterium gregoryi]AFZ72849.1 hypothetical protein Natgr_1645 [Natronobacterium gregoryi SP2]ELY69663.1 hypothetical protein C490_07661 [Natronobacterium gregoryi SP2]PLK21922.1 DUF1684 domain-containing protein [Natronobacterium gregoryi SP2]SFI65701.1 hypothetical protein SAMN05443661_10311 [Natronobacterium gregoryi]